jgi:hypothetical protein
VLAAVARRTTRHRLIAAGLRRVSRAKKTEHGQTNRYDGFHRLTSL